MNTASNATKRRDINTADVTCTARHHIHYTIYYHPFQDMFYEEKCKMYKSAEDFMIFKLKGVKWNLKKNTKSDTLVLDTYSACLVIRPL